MPENACNTVNVSCLRMSCKGSVERSSAVNRQNNGLCIKVNDSVEFMPFLVGNILGNYVGTSLDVQVLLPVYADIELERIVCSVDSECNIVGIGSELCRDHYLAGGFHFRRSK